MELLVAVCRFSVQKMDVPEICGSQWLFECRDSDLEFTPEFVIRRLMLPLSHHHLFVTVGILKYERERVKYEVLCTV